MVNPVKWLQVNCQKVAGGFYSPRALGWVFRGVRWRPEFDLLSIYLGLRELELLPRLLERELRLGLDLLERLELDRL